jgi:hypothetical protein
MRLPGITGKHIPLFGIGGTSWIMIQQAGKSTRLSKV